MKPLTLCLHPNLTVSQIATLCEAWDGYLVIDHRTDERGNCITRLYARRDPPAELPSLPALLRPQAH